MYKLIYLLLFFFLLAFNQTFGDREMVELLENGSTEACLSAIDKHPIYINKTLSNYMKGSTTISIAAYYGRNEIIRYLHSQGANLTKTNQYGHAPIHRAVSVGNFHTVELLLDLGADVNSVEIDILNNKYSQSPLSIAALDRRFDIAKLLIERGANINGTKPEDIPPLFFATQMGSIEITNLLLNSGANPLMEVWGKSILDYSREKALCSGKENDQKIVELLENNERKLMLNKRVDQTGSKPVEISEQSARSDHP